MDSGIISLIVEDYLVAVKVVEICTKYTQIPNAINITCIKLTYWHVRSSHTFI